MKGNIALEVCEILEAMVLWNFPLFINTTKTQQTDWNYWFFCDVLKLNSESFFFFTVSTWHFILSALILTLLSRLYIYICLLHQMTDTHMLSHSQFKFSQIVKAIHAHLFTIPARQTFNETGLQYLVITIGWQTRIVSLMWYIWSNKLQCFIFIFW